MFIISQFLKDSEKTEYFKYEQSNHSRETDLKTQKDCHIKKGIAFVLQCSMEWQRKTSSKGLILYNI